MKLIHLVFAAFLLTAVSCTKKSGDMQVTPASSYLNTSGGSSWNYHQVDSAKSTPVNSDYTISSTANDTSINNRTYHVYSNSTGGRQYLNLSGNNYYQFDSLPAGLGKGVFEELYLKDNAAVGTTWTQTQTVMVTGSPVPVPVLISFTIAEKNISRMVNTTNYSNVIHVSTTISSSLIPAASLTSSINNYYAPNYGLIESSTKVNLNYLGIVANVNLTVMLLNATLK
ncbi:MAG: hypothetical protein ABIY62_08450 [Ginsengibacter sp.]